MRTLEDQLNFNSGPSVEILKIAEHSERKILFYGGLDNVFVFYQHGLFKPNPKSKFPPKEGKPVVSQDIIFECLRTSKSDPIEKCPGCLAGDTPNVNYVTPVLVDGDATPKVFFFKSQVRKIIETGFDLIDRDKEMFKRTWFKISNSGYPEYYIGGLIPFGQFTGDLPEILDVTPFVKAVDIPFVADKLKQEGLLTDGQRALYPESNEIPFDTE